jgi:myo-inositol-1(or 4)-monophosphatase
MTAARASARPHPALLAATDAAIASYFASLATFDRASLLEDLAMGADGTPTKRLDELVETAVIEATEPFGVDIVSEECGYIDRGSSLALVIDPVDGTGNAASGIPISAFTAALAVDGQFVQGLTHWFDLDRRWFASVDDPTTATTTRATSLDGALVSMIRPKADPSAFLRIAQRTSRVRVLGSSAIEAALVATGVLDAACDPGSDTHRLVDVAAAVVLLGQAGGSLIDAFGRPIEFTTDVERRWSTIAAATPELASEMAAVISG